MPSQPRGQQGPAGLLAAALAADPARPAVTFYDDRTGERVELSVATLENWVAKTANLLRDGLGAEPGARVAVHLPLHWLAPVWLLACWSAGSLVVPGGDPGEADVVVTGPPGLPEALASGSDVVALSLRPMGAGFTHQLPAGVLDYAAEVLAYGDRFAPSGPAAGDSPALELGPRVWTGRELATVDDLGLRPGDRVLTTLAYDAWPALHTGLLAPLVAGAGLVLVSAPEEDADRLAGRATQERVTACVGARLAGVRTLLSR